MKFRIRSNRITRIINIQEPIDGRQLVLADLHLIIKAEMCLFNFHLSLNGKDILSDPAKSLSELGIISGDTLYIIPKECADQANRTARECNRERSPLSPTRNFKYPTFHEPMCVNNSNAGNQDNEKPSTSKQEDENLMDVESSGANIADDKEVNQYLNEPAVVSDSTDLAVPHKLRLYFQNASPKTKAEATVLVCHVLMLESGYYTTPDQNSLDYDMPEGWRKPGHFIIEYGHAMCPSVSFKVTFVTVGPILAIYGVVEPSLIGTNFEISLKVGNYISPESSLSEPTKTYQDLSSLSRTFKDCISHAMVQACCDDSQGPMRNSLVGLMTEIKLKILRYLDSWSLVQISKCNQEFSVLGKEPELWRRLCIRDFRVRVDLFDRNENWYKIYKDKHMARKRIRERRRIFADIFTPTIPLLPRPPLPRAPPGFIGGNPERDPDFMDPLNPPFNDPLRPRPRLDPRLDPPLPPLPPFDRRHGRGGGAGSFFPGIL